MASVRARLEEVSTDDDDESSSMAPYNTFNSLPTEDSLEQIRRRNTDINGDPAHYQRTDSGVEEKPAWAKVFKSRCFKCVDITATVMVVSLIWMVMALPTGLYAFTVLGVRFQSGMINILCSYVPHLHTIMYHMAVVINLLEQMNLSLRYSPIICQPHICL